MSSPTVWLTTLGCAKNQVDSDKLAALLAEAGYGRATDPTRADVVMVNTCAFIEAARAESVETILELEQAKRPDANLVVLGCMAQRFGSEISEALPEADAVLGLDRGGRVRQAVHFLRDSSHSWEAAVPPPDQHPRRDHRPHRSRSK